MRCALIFCASAALLLVMAACGTPGVPLPPSLNLPKPVNDLSATRVGDKVNIRFHAPLESTDRQNLKKLGSITLEQCPGTAATACSPLQEWKPGSLAPGAEAKMSLPLPHEPVLALIAKNDRARDAGHSNLAYVPLIAAWPNAASVTASLSADAVVLTIGDSAKHAADTADTKDTNDSNDAGASYRFRITRSQGDQRPQTIADIPATSYEFHDNNFEWQQRYTYTVHTVNRVTGPDGEPVEFESGPPVSTMIETIDTFPPSTPVGLAAVFNGDPAHPAIDLNWSPNTERDLAGYNVYRCLSTANGPAACVKLNTALVKTPSYSDATARPGIANSYTITAIDLRGNESSRSSPASERVPQP
jgi:hypothetical protein